MRVSADERPPSEWTEEESRLWNIESMRLWTTIKADQDRLASLFASASRPELRALTVICANDHAVIVVRRIAGHLIWSGKTTTRPMWTRDFSKKGQRMTKRHYGDLNVPSSEGPYGDLYEPEGSCKCGDINLEPPRTWVIEQCANLAGSSKRRAVWTLAMKRDLQ